MQTHYATQFLMKLAPEHWMIPTITPNKPKADPKISTTRIFTNVSGVQASEIAHPDPVTPTAILNQIIKYPQTKFDNPTETPVQKSEQPANRAVV